MGAQHPTPRNTALFHHISHSFTRHLALSARARSALRESNRAGAQTLPRYRRHHGSHKAVTWSRPTSHPNASVGSRQRLSATGARRRRRRRDVGHNVQHGRRSTTAPLDYCRRFGVTLEPFTQVSVLVCSVGGFVSGIRNQIMSVPSDAVAAMDKNAALEPSLSATSPDNVVLMEAPMPDAVPTMPCAKLKRPVPPVRSAMTSAVRTPSTVALMPSRA
jgi:hypothetical protein